MEESASGAKIIVGFLLFALTMLTTIETVSGRIDSFVATLIISAYASIQALIIADLAEKEKSYREWGGIMIGISTVGVTFFAIALTITVL